MIVFHTNCSLPNVTVSFVTSPDTRSTLGILWSSLSVIFLSSWVVLHMQAPDYERNSTFRDRLWAKMGNFVLRFIVSLSCIFAPEGMVGVAMDEWITAKCLVARAREYAEDDGIELDLQYAFLLKKRVLIIQWPKDDGSVVGRDHRGDNIKDDNDDSGNNYNNDDTQYHGDAIKNTSNDSVKESNDVHEEERNDNNETDHKDSQDEVAIKTNGNDEDGNGAGKNGLNGAIDNIQSNYDERDTLIPLNFLENGPLPTKEFTQLTTNGLLLARKNGLLAKLPYIPVEEIDGFSKSDVLSKFITIGQITWLAVQIIVRLSQHLEVSPLEVSALAFSTCSLVAYTFWWQCPQNPSGYKVVRATRCPTSQEKAVIETASNSLTPEFKMGRPGSRLQALLASQSDDLGFWSIPIAAFIFGAVHCLAWNANFPTYGEKIAWRTSSLVIGIFPAVMYSFIVAYETTRFLNIILWLPGIVYILARLFIIVESFRTLGFLPPTAYKDTWTTYLPHI